MRWLPCIAVGLLICNVVIPTDAQPDATGADCGCLWQGSFSEVAATTDLVLLGEVQRVKGNAVDLKPERVLMGQFWLDSVRVWMHTRNYCRPPAEEFPDGSRWIMALAQIHEVPEDGFNPSTPNQSYGRPYDYALSSCGGYWLKVNGNTAVGNLVPDMPRFYHQPDMSPVLIDLIDGYLQGTVSEAALIEASREHPNEVNKLILDTRSFLRGQDKWLEEATPTRGKPRE